MIIRTKNDTLNIVESAIEYLRSGIDNLRNHVLNRTIIIDLNLEIVDSTKHDLLSKIASFNPATMCWSNICDYMNYSDFHEMCRKCSSSVNKESTQHYFYSMNWPRITYGTTHIDFMNLNENIKEQIFQDALKKSNYAFSILFELFDCERLLLSQPVDDLRNLIDFPFCVLNYESWVKHFLSKSKLDQSKLEEQTIDVNSFYNVFSHSNSTIYCVICYD